MGQVLGRYFVAKGLKMNPSEGGVGLLLFVLSLKGSECVKWKWIKSCFFRQENKTLWEIKIILDDTKDDMINTKRELAEWYDHSKILWKTCFFTT